MSDPLKIIMDERYDDSCSTFDAVYKGGIDIMRIKMAVQHVRVLGGIHLWNILCLGRFYTLGIFDDTAFECSSFTISYRILLRIPYIRDILWLFHVSNILLVVSSFYIKGFYLFFILVL